MESNKNLNHIINTKKWFVYLLEFILLFFAVFLGLVGDDYREQKLDEHQEKIYVTSLINDLIKDSTSLSEVLSEFIIKDKNLDTVIRMYRKLKISYNDTLWRNFSGFRGFPDFIYSNITILQLINSSGLNLIKSNKVKDEIIRYDSNVKDLNIDIASLDERYTLIRDLIYEIIDKEDFENDRRSMSIIEIEKKGKNYLLINDIAKLGKLNNVIRDYKNVIGLVVKKEKQLKQKAINLIFMLKKEYNK